MKKQSLRIGGSRLQLKEKLSRRGVFRAWDVRQRQERLISILPDNDDTRRRIRVWKKVGSFHSVFPKLIRTEETNGKVITLSHWIKGSSLKAYLQRHRNATATWPSLYESIRLYRGLVHGLANIHAHGIVHGDISPANLVLQGPKPTRLVLIDSGSAWSLGENTRGGHGVSEFYAAPEFFCEPLGPPSYLSDQFSATVVLYELLTGRLPFGGMGGKVGQLGDSYPPLSTESKGFCDQSRYSRRTFCVLEECLERGLGLSPDDRFTHDGSWRSAVDELWHSLRPKETNAERWLSSPLMQRVIRWLAKTF